MNVLWFVNIPFPAVLRHLGRPIQGSGWWLTSLADTLRTTGQVRLSVAHCSGMFPRFEKLDIDDVTYYCLPQSLKSTLGLTHKREIRYALRAVEDCAPDLINVHGTEFFYGLIARHLPIPVLITLQGIMTEIMPRFFGDFTLPGVLCRQVRGIHDVKSLLITLWIYAISLARARSERRIFQVNSRFIGRTDWDHDCQQRFSPGAIYHTCHELMRPIFRSVSWTPDACRPRQVFCTSSPQVYKGSHVLIEAAARLVREFPDIAVRIAGGIGPQGWGGYLRRLAKRCGVESNVTFLGYLTDRQIADELLRANLYVCPSFIENSPNTLAEAMSVGLPCIASDAGGIPSLIQDGTNGLLFPTGNHVLLAEGIRRLLLDPTSAATLGRIARESARNRHNPDKIPQALLDIYQSVIPQ